MRQGFSMNSRLKPMMSPKPSGVAAPAAAEGGTARKISPSDHPAESIPGALSARVAKTVHRRPQSHKNNIDDCGAGKIFFYEELNKVRAAL